MTSYIISIFAKITLLTQRTMKKICLSIALSVCVLFGFSPSKATCSVDPPIPGWIEIGEGGGEIPRMPSIIPIRGFYWGNTIYLSFSEDLGDVDVTLEEYYDGLILHTR